MAVYIVGDVHGRWHPVLSHLEILVEPGDTVIFVGDLDLTAPLTSMVRPLTDGRGANIKFIMGNHDMDGEQNYDLLMDSPSEWHMHGKVTTIERLRIGGLGGVFRSWWFAKLGDDEPKTGRDRYLRGLRPADRFRNGMPLRHRDSIWKEDIAALVEAGPCDVVVSHEAPTCHKHGFAALDTLYKSVGARLAVHGHHHRSYVGQVGATQVRGLALGEVWRLEMPTPPA